MGSTLPLVERDGTRRPYQGRLCAADTADKQPAMAAPLEGIRVIELIRVAPGAFCTMMLADMGADVVKIETPNAEDPYETRSSDPVREAQRAAFRFVDRNKRSVAINLKDADGQQILRRLATDADVLVEGFRPGVMGRLGGDYETLSAINPRLVYCSLSGFGQTGPYRDLPAHDINYLAIAGVLGLIGEKDRPPAIPLNLVADYAGASMHGVAGILLALFARERTGRAGCRRRRASMRRRNRRRDSAGSPAGGPSRR